MTPAGTAPSSRPFRAGAGAAGFLGREKEISELVELSAGERLITLTGAPGIGKSRLALELTGRLSGRFAGGTGFVELAAISRSTDVAGALAFALSVQEVGGEGLVETIVARLSRRRTLVVLDNCEHLLEASAELVDALRSACPELHVLVTSREPLGLDDERIWQVSPLALPAVEEVSAEGLIAYPAVALFVARAQVTRPGFSLNSYVAPRVAEICRRLDGIPLAIELAAARVDSLTPEEIARRLDDRFGLLTKAGDSGLAHHQTLQAALDWSHELLSGPERALLRRLSVFVGGFALEAAEVVCAGGELEADRVGDLLSELFSKSLVVGGGASSSAERYGLLETIRAYAGERLEAADEAAGRRGAHAHFYLALAEQAEPELTGPRQQEWFECVETERANLRAAIEWSLGHGEQEQALRLAGALVLFWRVRCHLSEGRELLEAVVLVSHGAPAGLRAKALWGAGFMALMTSDHRAALPALEESAAVFRELRDTQGYARALLILGNCMQFCDAAAVQGLLAESAALAREADDSWCLGLALAVAGFEFASHGELPLARPRFEECIAVAREAHDEQALRLGLIGLGSVAVRQGDYGAAEVLLEEAVTVSRELGDGYTQATAMQQLGRVALRRGDRRRARSLLESALAILPEVGPAHAILGPLTLVAWVTLAEGDRGGARRLFEEAEARAGGDFYLPALLGLAELTAQSGDLDDARRRFEEALALARAREDSENAAQALHGLGRLTGETGDARHAATLHIEALELEHRMGAAPEIAASLEALAGLAAAAGRHRHAAWLLGAAHGLRETGGFVRAPWEALRYEADKELVQRSLPAEEHAAAGTEGAGASVEQAVAQAAKGWGRHGRPAAGWSDLTEAEQQIAALVAEGLTNKIIAERLSVAPTTVKNHLSHIFAKLGLARRSELAAEVWRRRQQPSPSGPAPPEPM